MPTSRVAQFCRLGDASWFLARKARELQDHDAVPSASMLLLAQSWGSLKGMAASLLKQMIAVGPFGHAVAGKTLLARISEIRAVEARSHCFVLLSYPLGDADYTLFRYLRSSRTERAYISLCLDALPQAEEVAFLLDAELSPVIESLEPGVVYFRKARGRWLCEWPDRPSWVVPRMLLCVCECLAERQRAFLEHGIRQIVPLKMQQIANGVGCHVTSVSRVISGVEAQTDWGRFPLKSFFSGKVETDAGSISPVRVKSRIVEIIEQEDKKRSLSDEAIRDTLTSEGVSVSRRTVTKYRLALGIPSARERRRAGKR